MQLKYISPLYLYFILWFLLLFSSIWPWSIWCYIYSWSTLNAESFDTHIALKKTPLSQVEKGQYIVTAMTRDKNIYIFRLYSSCPSLWHRNMRETKLGHFGILLWTLETCTNTTSNEVIIIKIKNLFLSVINWLKIERLKMHWKYPKAELKKAFLKTQEFEIS